MPDHTPQPNNVVALGSSRSPDRGSNVETEPLDFFEALKQVAMGRAITKQEWGNPDIHCLLLDGKLSIKNGTLNDGRYHVWILTSGDMAGDDWLVL